MSPTERASIICTCADSPVIALGVLLAIAVVIIIVLVIILIVKQQQQQQTKQAK